MLICFSCKEAKQQAPEVEVDTEWVGHQGELFAYGICVDSLEVNHYTIKSGDSPAAIFAKLGFSARMNDSLCRASSEVLDPKRLRTGMTYATITTQDSLATIQYIVFAKSKTNFSIIDLTGDSIHAYEYNKAVRLERRYLEGGITTTLWSLMRAKGVNTTLALQIADIFAWQVDFFDIKEGDSIRALYEVAFVDDTTELYIASVEGLLFTHQGKDFIAIPFVQDSIREFFDEEGNSLRKEFLKAPLDFSRITSRFSSARFHPILKITRAHYGIDYSAPVGTPVRAIGDGIVVSKGWAGDGGNTIQIKHNSVYTTSYMHLQGLAKEVQLGGFVKQGMVIGYVGATGLATGAHLDFRVYKNGQPINPMLIESPPSEPVKPELMDSFNQVKQAVFKDIQHRDTAYHRE